MLDSPGVSGGCCAAMTVKMAIDAPGRPAAVATCGHDGGPVWLPARDTLGGVLVG